MQFDADVVLSDNSPSRVDSESLGIVNSGANSCAERGNRIRQSMPVFADFERLYNVGEDHLTGIRKLSKLNNNNLEQAELFVCESKDGRTFIENIKREVDSILHKNCERRPLLQEHVQKLRSGISTLEGLKQLFNHLTTYAAFLENRITGISQLLAKHYEVVTKQVSSSESDMHERNEDDLKEKVLNYKSVREEKETLLGELLEQAREQKERKDDVSDEIAKLEAEKASLCEKYDLAVSGIRELDKELSLSKKNLEEITDRHATECKKIDVEQKKLESVKAAVRNLTRDSAIFTSLLEPKWKDELQIISRYRKEGNNLDSGVTFQQNTSTISTGVVNSTKQGNNTDLSQFAVVKNELDEALPIMINNVLVRSDIMPNRNVISQENLANREVKNVDANPPESQFKFPQPPPRFRSPLGDNENSPIINQTIAENDADMSRWSISRSYDM
uniref:CARD domain-containing protein n=1 Tax=Syphacia muris TaxID=451379 RepID=A0A0N5AGG5_9BILA